MRRYDETTSYSIEWEKNLTINSGAFAIDDTGIYTYGGDGTGMAIEKRDLNTGDIAGLKELY